MKTRKYPHSLLIGCFIFAAMPASSVVTVVTAREMCREQNNAATPTDKRRTVRQAPGSRGDAAHKYVWEERRDLE